VRTFTDKARIEEYIKEQHGDMIGIFPAIAGFYTNWGSVNALRCATAVLVCPRSLRLTADPVDRRKWIPWPPRRVSRGDCSATASPHRRMT